MQPSPNHKPTEPIGGSGPTNNGSPVRDCRSQVHPCGHRSRVAPESPTRYREHDIGMQFVWLLTTFFQAPSIVGKSWKRTWPSEACITSHTASPSYTAIFHKVCVDLINSSQLLLNYIRTSLQVAVDHLGRSTW